MACLIAAPSSGSGKTLLTLSLIAWARQQGRSIQPFKVGPDYLDPQLLTAASGRPCRNLDLSLCGEDWVRGSFLRHGSTADLAVVEGVMGLFDGIGPSSDGSSAAVAAALQLPVVLVVDASGQAQSLAALVRGFQQHDPSLRLAGVVLNRVSSPRHRELLDAVLDGIEVPLLGSLPRNLSLELPSRHLGLAPAHELERLEGRLEAWASLAQEHLDLGALLPLLQPPSSRVPPLESLHAEPPNGTSRSLLPVAVAQDAAFHFRYPEMQESLEALGMPVLPWSPLADEAIPEEATGLILPGGFPEQHAAALSECQQSLTALRHWFRQRPLYAECGGMLLLGQTLTDLEGRAHPMAGVLPFGARRGDLQVGYRQLTATADSLLLRKGERYVGHEFHRWSLKTVGKEESLWQVEGWRSQRREEGWNLNNVHASWVHLHWGGCSTISCRWRAALEAGATARAGAS
ncbi:cobyrinate a,c-diamide synthase [Synechococcus sp. HK01-R]|uniref:cobyrinate a,c-diamide synthase n=1 Tax=Synechococcus sp. HK01-R TaxID=2751171 RepID=UPI001624BB60|nr:cobyrinate a,c-diamide synthase [Synechococcus sp. HK01-R]QNG26360.1 cobyrinate a,c-diamide synthase [Synechococcus sp. HK01-R]